MPRRQPALPWGKLAALLTASFATLVGVMCGVEPHIILWRAIVSSLGIGGIVAVCAPLLTRLLSRRVESRRR